MDFPKKNGLLAKNKICKALAECDKGEATNSSEGKDLGSIGYKRWQVLPGQPFCSFDPWSTKTSTHSENQPGASGASKDLNAESMD